MCGPVQSLELDLTLAAKGPAFVLACDMTMMLDWR